MINIAILEDNLYLQRRLFNTLKDWEKVTSLFAFSTNDDFKSCLKQERIDVLLVDLDLPDGSGVKSIKAISKANKDNITIVISSTSATDNILEAIAGGAIGFLHKEDKTYQVKNAIEMALSGNSPISPAIAHKICINLQISEPIKKIKRVVKKGLLTPREIEVLTLIAKGLSYSEVSNVLEISANTLPVHIRNIYRKLQSKNRSEAVFEAQHLGLLP